MNHIFMSLLSFCLLTNAILFSSDIENPEDVTFYSEDSDGNYENAIFYSIDESENEDNLFITFVLPIEIMHKIYGYMNNKAKKYLASTCTYYEQAYNKYTDNCADYIIFNPDIYLKLGQLLVEPKNILSKQELEIVESLKNHGYRKGFTKEILHTFFEKAFSRSWSELMTKFPNLKSISFKNCVYVKNLNFHAIPNIIHITHLNLSNCGLKSTIGIDKFKNLTDLDISENEGIHTDEDKQRNIYCLGKLAKLRTLNLTYCNTGFQDGCSLLADANKELKIIK